MRIAVVNQSAGGGASVAAESLMTGLRSRGHQLRYFPEEKPESSMVVITALEEWKPDIVHAHCWYTEYDYDLLERLSHRFATVFTVHDVAVVNQYGTACWECYRNSFCVGCPDLSFLRRYRPNYRIFERLKKRRINSRTRCHLVFPSAWMRQRLARTEWSRCEGTIIPYGIDTAFWTPATVVREHVNLPAGPLILCAANMYSAEDHRKGIPDLLRAFALVRRVHPAAQLVLAGQIRGVSPEPGMIFRQDLGREALRAHYQASDVFCLPSRGDNLPLALLESQSCGLPAVATRVGGIPEAIFEGDTADLVAGGDVIRLAEALVRLLEDRERRLRYGRNARERALRLFGIATTTAAHEALYQRLMALRPEAI